jgi:putative inorganic carbon (hco3(-)) transporter
LSTIVTNCVLLGAALALTTSVGLDVGSSWFDEQRILLTPALLLSAVSTLTWRRTAEGGNRLARAMLFLLAAGAMSSALSARPLLALLEVAVLMLVAVAVVGSASVDARNVRVAAASFAVIVSGAYVTGVVANMVSAWILQMPIGRDTFLVGFSNPRFPAQLQALTMPLLPLAMVAVRHRGARLGLGVVFALWWMCLIGSGSRTAWLALVVAGVVVLVVGPAGRRWLKWQLAFAVTGTVLYVVVFHAVAPLTGAQVELESGRFQEGGSIAARLQLAQLALKMAAEHPLLGVGPMHFAYVDNGLGAHPHNFWLQLAAEWGIPVSVLVGALAGVLLVRVLQTARETAADPEHGLVPSSLLAALVAWLVGTQLDGYMVAPTSQVASMVILMLCVALVRLQQTPVAAVRVSRSGLVRSLAWTPAAIVLLASAVVLALPLTPFGQPTEREMLWRRENPTAPYWPRFWQQGWIGPDADATARHERPK